MNILYKLSLAISLFFLIVLLFLGFRGKNIATNFFFKNVIEVRYHQKVSMYRNTPTKKGAIIFLGNSLTEGGNWSELFNHPKILNRGIGGDVTEGVLNRLDEIVRHEPSKLFICIGTNDLAKGITETTIINNYKAILEQIRRESPSTKIYVQSLLPVGDHILTPHDNAKIPSLNAKIQLLCKQMDIQFIDLFDIFLGPNGFLNEKLTNDNLHLMGEGYLLWKEQIIDFVLE